MPQQKILLSNVFHKYTLLSLTHLSSEALFFKTTLTINLRVAPLSLTTESTKGITKILTPQLPPLGDPKVYRNSKQMGNTRIRRTSQKTPHSSAERCYFPSSAPEHNPVHGKQHLALLNSASVPMDKLHTICIASRERVNPTHIWPMDTNSCGGLQAGGKGQEPY